jgi:hypothetical protein
MTLAIHTARLRTFLTRLETTRIGGIGAGTAVASAVTLLAQGLARGAIAAVIAPHLGAGAAAAANALLDSAVSGASTSLVPAIALAYVGRGPLGSVADTSSATPAPVVESPILSTEGTAAPIAAPVQVANPVASNGRPRLAPITALETAALQGGKEQIPLNAFESMILSAFKKQLVAMDESLIAEIQAVKPEIEAEAAAGGASAETLVLNTVTKAASAKFGWFAALLPEVQPQLQAALGALVANGVTQVGPLLDAACAFLKREEAYL